MGDHREKAIKILRIVQSLRAIKNDPNKLDKSYNEIGEIVFTDKLMTDILNKSGCSSLQYYQSLSLLKKLDHIEYLANTLASTEGIGINNVGKDLYVEQELTNSSYDILGGFLKEKTFPAGSNLDNIYNYLLDETTISNQTKRMDTLGYQDRNGKMVWKEGHRERAEKLGIDSFEKFTQMSIPDQLAFVRKMKDEVRKEKIGPREKEFISKTTSETVQILKDWAKGPKNLEKPQGSSIHHMVDFLSNPITKNVNQFSQEKTDARKKRLIEMGSSGEYHSFLVNHDWFKAFKNIEGFSSGEFQLPFDKCCFEFRISGIRILVFVNEKQQATIIAGVNNVWVLNPGYFVDIGVNFRPIREDGTPWSGSADELFNPIAEIVFPQIRAVCIMLEAEVAEHEVIRASHALNKQRIKKNKIPTNDYHIVNLAKRHRAKPKEDRERSEYQGIVKCHLRRGHWRHYNETEKTWIKWMLVGNPDLGFVEKHYTL